MTFSFEIHRLKRLISSFAQLVPGKDVSLDHWNFDSPHLVQQPNRKLPPGAPQDLHPDLSSDRMDPHGKPTRNLMSATGCIQQTVSGYLPQRS